MEDFLKKAKDSSAVIATLNGQQKRMILEDMADALDASSDDILAANAIDMQYAEQNSISDALKDRLMLDSGRVADMAQSLREIAALREPVGRVLDGWYNDSNLKIEKVSVPIGVVGVIYESRPNVTADVGALCFKSGNVAILKGGKEAENSNRAISSAMQGVLLKHGLPAEAIALLPDSTREGVANLIKQDKFVDLIVPRGGEALIRFVSTHATVPVVKHDKGLCHTFVDKDADLDKAIAIAINAKCRRTGICGAMETLLVHADIAQELLPLLKVEFDTHGTQLRGCQTTKDIIGVELASDEDWSTEYLDNILSIKVLSSADDAIEHIATYGSGHSDAIITENYTVAEQFLDAVDSACVYLNASTQFTDGGQFGFGAEVGISTNKLHARGPMGINELTTYKYKIYGNGQTRA
ncbi:MAG TPA: glutamate-5-semialdehyde dehydrogenase [Sulfurovum sp.]|nr:glutamate-5-semialdehyde dehydrogenase [Sulfurovum sp.]